MSAARMEGGTANLEEFLATPLLRKDVRRGLENGSKLDIAIDPD
jgi:hypothetical protein